MRPISLCTNVIIIITIILLHFTGLSVPITARVHSTPVKRTTLICFVHIQAVHVGRRPHLVEAELHCTLLGDASGELGKSAQKWRLVRGRCHPSWVERLGPQPCQTTLALAPAPVLQRLRIFPRMFPFTDVSSLHRRVLDFVRLSVSSVLFIVYPKRQRRKKIPKMEKLARGATGKFEHRMM